MTFGSYLELLQSKGYLTDEDKLKGLKLYVESCDAKINYIVGNFLMYPDHYFKDKTLLAIKLILTNWAIREADLVRLLNEEKAFVNSDFAFDILTCLAFPSLLNDNEYIFKILNAGTIIDEDKLQAIMLINESPSKEAALWALEMLLNTPSKLQDKKFIYASKIIQATKPLLMFKVLSNSLSIAYEINEDMAKLIDCTLNKEKEMLIDRLINYESLYENNVIISLIRFIIYPMDATIMECKIKIRSNNMESNISDIFKTIGLKTKSLRNHVNYYLTLLGLPTINFEYEDMASKKEYAEAIKNFCANNSSEEIDLDDVVLYLKRIKEKNKQEDLQTSFFDIETNV